MSPLSRLLVPAILLGLSFPALAEKPKFGTFDAARAFEAYYITVQEKIKIAQARAGLKKDPRLEVIKLTRVELLDFRNKVRDASLSDNEREEFFRKFQMKAHELRSLQRDTIQHVEEKSKDIDKAMVEKTKELLNQVRAVVHIVAKKEGFDYVFEQGGNTSSQIPTLLYIRGATDITDLVIETLNKDKPKDKEVATATARTP